AFVESVRTGSGTLMLVMQAAEGGPEFRNSWGDGEFNGNDAFLSTNADVDMSDDPNLAVDQELAFGQVAPGDGPFMRTLTIGNSGASELLTVISATLTGANPAQFQVTGGTFPLQINSGESSDIEITFDPGQDLGLFQATLELASDDQSDAVVEVALSGTSEAPSTENMLTNNGDSWVRESAPGTAYPADLMSVWNSSSSDGARRYGVISFDLTSITKPLSEVSLSLWSALHGYSDDIIPLKQTAIAIDPTGIDPDAATWSQVTSADTLYIFDSLGTYDIPAASAEPAIQNVFLESVGSAADAAFVESVRTGSGTLMLVMIADPDATNYSNSWGDAELNGEDAFLSYELTQLRLQLQIDYNPVADELTVSWESKMGLLYTLRSETGLSTEPGSWPIFAGLEDLPADPSGTNSETFSLPADPERFFVVGQSPAPPVAVLPEENFDGAAPPNLPSGWTTGANPTDTGTTAWELGSPSTVGPPFGANSVPNCVGTNISAVHGFDTDIWLRTPSIDLVAAASATLTFQQFKDIEDFFDFGKISVLDATDDSEIAVIEDLIDGATADWTKVTKAMPAAAIGKTVKIEFRFQADDVGNFAGWYIDDVEVTVP
ncbi:MAG TPA: choice-of-anchor D domain-containing protein, partial [Roseibacillus sp.]|nr:choice-of-anchor D domain-containing protein [Roseibacillus sp.]